MRLTCEKKHRKATILLGKGFELWCFFHEWPFVINQPGIGILGTAGELVPSAPSNAIKFLAFPPGEYACCTAAAAVDPSRLGGDMEGVARSSVTVVAAVEAYEVAKTAEG